MLDSARRYYLGVAAVFAIEGEYDQTSERISERDAFPHPPLPSDLPARKKLELVISAEILRYAARTVYTYQTLDDLAGADAAELARAGLTLVEIKKVLDYLEV